MFPSFMNTYFKKTRTPCYPYRCFTEGLETVRGLVGSASGPASLLWHTSIPFFGKVALLCCFFVGPKPNNFAKPTSRRQCLPCRGAQPWNATARGERLHRPGDEKLHASRAIYFCGFNWPMWCAAAARKNPGPSLTQIPNRLSILAQISTWLMWPALSRAAAGVLGGPGDAPSHSVIQPK